MIVFFYLSDKWYFMNCYEYLLFLFSCNKVALNLQNQLSSRPKTGGTLKVIDVYFDTVVM